MWVNALFVVFSVAYFLCTKLRHAIQGDEIMYALVLANVNLFLRTGTRDPIAFKKQGLLLLPLLFLFGCAGADIKVWPDPNPAPLDVNFHNLLVDATCAKGPQSGQIGCSLPYNEDLSKQWLTIFSPLGGSLRVYSRTCGADKNYYLSKGEIFNIPLDDLVPPKADFCTFSIYMRWEKPPQLKTEVPFRGQSAKFYVRMRPQGTQPATLMWTPPQGGTKEAKGILYAQFRALTTAVGHREPVLLQIKTSSSVTRGKYQLWSEAKKIGIKTGDFSGDEIFISRDDLLGPAKVDSYELTGWAVGVNRLDLNDDFRVAVDIFRYDTVPLTAKIYFSGDEVCYETESTVSLVVISNNEEASNNSKGCFSKPEGDAVMGFFTNVGRATYAIVSGDKITWLQ